MSYKVQINAETLYHTVYNDRGDAITAFSISKVTILISTQLRDAVFYQWFYGFLCA